MSEAWIQLQCPDCGTDWEADPNDLPAPGETFDCDHCGTTRRASEFPHTDRDFEILERLSEV